MTKSQKKGFSTTDILSLMDHHAVAVMGMWMQKMFMLKNIEIKKGIIGYINLIFEKYKFNWNYFFV